MYCGRSTNHYDVALPHTTAFANTQVLNVLEEPKDLRPEDIDLDSMILLSTCFCL
jgi:hypothetical protein